MQFLFEFPRITIITNFVPTLSINRLRINRAIKSPTTCLLKRSDITNCNAHYLCFMHIFLSLFDRSLVTPPLISILSLSPSCSFTLPR